MIRVPPPRSAVGTDVNVSATPWMTSDAFHRIFKIVGELCLVDGSEGEEFGSGDKPYDGHHRNSRGYLVPKVNRP